MKNKTLNVKEIFFSLQGEGANAGKPIIFIRLAECNLSCHYCDTDFKNGEKFTLRQISDILSHFPVKNILWTGGEPTLQLTNEIIAFFKDLGYWQAIETNGTKKVPDGLDWVTISPKIALKKVCKLNPIVDEIRIPTRIWDTFDFQYLPAAKYYYLSPVFNGNELDKENLDYCLKIIKTNQDIDLRLSVQIHKLINIQ